MYHQDSYQGPAVWNWTWNWWQWSEQGRRRKRPARLFKPFCVTASGAAEPVDAASRQVEASACQEDLLCRAGTEDVCCFVSFATLDDEDSVLGLGLYAHRRSNRQARQKLPPDVDLTLDYLDVEAFNAGMYAAGSSRRALDALEGSGPAMVSSSRGRLNAWLPLYINAEHWARARRYVASAFAALSCRGAHHSDFRPEDALAVCCSLLTNAAAGFAVGQTQNKASERGIQTYVDVHRLLLQLGQEWPAIAQAARCRLRSFIDHPESRTREKTPSLGDLMHCLFVVEDITWEELERAIIPEALRRHVWRSECKGRSFDKAAFDGSSESLLREWGTFAPEACRVLSFALHFLRLVGRPTSTPLREVVASYDRRWGRLPAMMKAELVSFCAELQKHPLQGVLELMDRSYLVDDLAEMVLWAVKHGATRGSQKKASGRPKEAAVPFEEWPSLSLGASLPLLGQLKANKEQTSLKRAKRLRSRRSCAASRQPRWTPVEHAASDAAGGVEDLEHQPDLNWQSWQSSLGMPAPFLPNYAAYYAGQFYWY
eukprot:TRINITY_DN90680_c0_g1_i1.p1 TRINITY_DN90680_c0_g1~~TRINITY_DN90680_c0_g1_i1.p1  ORF type:complete len:542 (+),score=101.17 TRINITY_DN90680_c0_g1_i1:49-1674(+)